MMLCGNCADGRPEACSVAIAEAYGMNMVLEDEIKRLRVLLSRIHEDALYKNECAWCHEDPADEHAEFVDEDGDHHPCFGEELHAAIRNAPCTTSASPEKP